MFMISSTQWIAWNITLALTPVALAYLLVAVSRLPASKPLRCILMATLFPVWLLFLPNTAYLITEWRHYFFVLDANNLYLQTQSNTQMFIPLLAVSVFYALYSGLGLITFTLAVRPLERMAARMHWPIWKWGFPFFVVVALGVYLGLVLRFNSWDMFVRSESVWHATSDVMSRPRLLGFIVGFGIFLWVVYEVLDIWVDAVVERLRRFTGGSKM